MSRPEFYEWSLNDEEFKRVWAEFEASGFKKVLKPSPDRLDTTKGYVKGNVEWVTMSENSFRAAKHLCIDKNKGTCDNSNN